MIKYDYEITVNGNTAKLNKDIHLFRENKNVHYYFAIKNASFNFKGSTDLIEKTNAINAAVTVIKPNGVEVANAIAPVENGKIHLKVTEDLIDEEVEVGDFDLVFDLFDDVDGAVTIPKVAGQFHVLERPCTTPISELVATNTTNEVDQALTDYAITTYAEPVASTNEDGTFAKKTWVPKEKITTAELNRMEEGISNVSSQCKDIAKQISQGVTTISKESKPKLFLEGTLPTSKTSITMESTFSFGGNLYKGYVDIKCQGSSSMTYPKKNFTIKFYKDSNLTEKMKFNFLNWGNQNKFCAKANWVDTLHLRNLVCAKLGYDMVKSRPDSEFKTNLLTAPRGGLVDGFPISIYLNGEFYGIYTMNIPKDDWTFNMDSANPNHMVLCGETNNDKNMSKISSCQFRKPWSGTDGDDWSVEVGTLTDTLKNSFNRCINFVMTASDSEFKTHISDYLDLYSLIDYYILVGYSCDVDSMARNMLMITYDGVHWGAGAYDLDTTFGTETGGSIADYATLDWDTGYHENNSLLFKRLRENFVSELKTRYNELRKNELNIVNTILHAEEIYDAITDRMFEDEHEKWTNLPSVATNTMTRFRKFVKDRTNYMDTRYNNMTVPVACTSLSLNKSTIELVNVGATETLIPIILPSNCTYGVSYVSDNPNIANIDNNGVVTAKATGNCVITATCGDKSVQCQVTVTVQTITVDSISLPATATLFTGDSIQLQATINPSNATNQNVTWSCDNQNVTLNPNGLSCTVTAVSGDSAIITVKTEDGEKVATCNITITNLTTTITLDGTEKWNKIGWPNWSDTTNYIPFETSINSKLPRGTILDESNTKTCMSIDGYDSMLSTVLDDAPVKGFALFCSFGNAKIGNTKIQLGIETNNLSSADVTGFKSYLANNNLTVKLQAIPDTLLNTITEFTSGIYDDKGQPVDHSSEKRSDIIELPSGASNLYTFTKSGISVVWFYDENQTFISKLTYGNKFEIPSNAKYFATRVVSGVTSLDWFAN